MLGNFAERLGSAWQSEIFPDTAVVLLAQRLKCRRRQYRDSRAFRQMTVQRFNQMFVGVYEPLCACLSNQSNVCLSIRSNARLNNQSNNRSNVHLSIRSNACLSNQSNYQSNVRLSICSNKHSNKYFKISSKSFCIDFCSDLWTDTYP